MFGATRVMPSAGKILDLDGVLVQSSNYLAGRLGRNDQRAGSRAVRPHSATSPSLIGATVNVFGSIMAKAELMCVYAATGICSNRASGPSYGFRGKITSRDTYLEA